MVKNLSFAVCMLGCALSSIGATRVQSQFEMNQAAGRELGAAESEMNVILARLLKMAEGKPQSLAKLKQSQAAWQAYRDAHMKAFWPSDDTRFYGSVHPMCVAVKLTAFTKERISELNEMTRREEGDVCGCQWPD